jgi:hypothetical protein
MKRWFSRDATKLKLGVVMLAAFAGFAVMGVAQGSRPAAEMSSGNTVANAPVEKVALSEKQKIAVTQIKVITTEEEVPFVTTQTFDGTLPKDSTVVRVEGSNGKKVIKTEVKMKDGVEVSRALISEEITVPAVAKVVAVGTKVVASRQNALLSGECDLHYTPCIKKTSRDLDCSDIGIRVQVVAIGEDPHGFDRNEDGVGCESYPDQQTTDRNYEE